MKVPAFEQLSSSVVFTKGPVWRGAIAENFKKQTLKYLQGHCFTFFSIMLSKFYYEIIQNTVNSKGKKNLQSQ